MNDGFLKDGMPLLSRRILFSSLLSSDRSPLVVRNKPLACRRLSLLLLLHLLLIFMCCCCRLGLSLLLLLLLLPPPPPVAATSVAAACRC